MSMSLEIENKELKDVVGKLKHILEATEKECDDLKVKLMVQQEIIALEEKKKNAFLEENKSLREKVQCLEKKNEALKRKARDEKNRSKRRHSLKEPTSSCEVSIDDSSLDSDQKAIRQHAQKMLLWANRAVDRQGYTTSNHSLCSSSNRTMDKSTSTLRNLIPRSPNNLHHRIPTDSTRKTPPLSFIKSKTTMSSLSSDDPINSDIPPSSTSCSCSEKIFASENGDADFFLPRIGTCKCGNESNAWNDLFRSNPFGTDGSLSLNLILRPWQAKFLRCISITSLNQLTTAMKERPQALARTLKLWYKKKKHKSLPTRSCLVALYIWNRTAQQTQRKLNHKQQVIGNMECITQHNILDLQFSVGNNTSSESSISTIGNSTMSRSIDFHANMDLENEI